jgi:hypothetical protein
MIAQKTSRESKVPRPCMEGRYGDSSGVPRRDLGVLKFILLLLHAPYDFGVDLQCAVEAFLELFNPLVRTLLSFGTWHTKSLCMLTAQSMDRSLAE